MLMISNQARHEALCEGEGFGASQAFVVCKGAGLHHGSRYGLSNRVRAKLMCHVEMSGEKSSSCVAKMWHVSVAGPRF